MLVHVCKYFDQQLAIAETRRITPELAVPAQSAALYQMLRAVCKHKQLQIWPLRGPAGREYHTDQAGRSFIINQLFIRALSSHCTLLTCCSGTYTRVPAVHCLPLLI